MKLKQIAFLVAGFIGSTSAFAVAVTPADIEAARIANTLDQVWITGASAPTKSVYEGFVGSGTAVGCDPTTQSIFTSQTGTNVTPGGLGNFIAYACKKGTRTQVAYHSIAGGSLTAYTPHTINDQTIVRLRFLGNACTTGGTNGVGALSYVDTVNANNNAAVFKGCTNQTLPITYSNLVGPGASRFSTDFAPNKPHGGFSDVEAALFPVSIGGGSVSSFGTEANAYVGQVFGVVVSTPLYRAMQTAQGLSDVNATTYEPANAPNITSAQYASLISAQFLSPYQADWAPIVGAANAGTQSVIIARRVDTSGTQASSNAFFLANPCAAGVSSSLGAATAADSQLPSFEVFEGSGTGDVKTRITRATLGQNAAGVATPNVNFAIGVVSAENNWRTDSATQNGYRFVKVDGFHPEGTDGTSAVGGPARFNAVNGNYPFHMEMKTFVSNYAKVANGGTTYTETIIPQIANNLANPVLAAGADPQAVCKVLPRGLTLNPANPTSSGNCTIGSIGQVTKYSKGGNNCAPQLLNISF